jgi:hypothetical protein
VGAAQVGGLDGLAWLVVEADREQQREHDEVEGEQRCEEDERAAGIASGATGAASSRPPEHAGADDERGERRADGEGAADGVPDAAGPDRYLDEVQHAEYEREETEEKGESRLSACTEPGEGGGGDGKYGEEGAGAGQGVRNRRPRLAMEGGIVEDVQAGQGEGNCEYACLTRRHRGARFRGRPRTRKDG